MLMKKIISCVLCIVVISALGWASSATAGATSSSLTTPRTPKTKYESAYDAYIRRHNDVQKYHYIQNALTKARWRLNSGASPNAIIDVGHAHGVLYQRAVNSGNLRKSSDIYYEVQTEFYRLETEAKIRSFRTRYEDLYREGVNKGAEPVIFPWEE